jgi:hypothetical protein
VYRKEETLRRVTILFIIAFALYSCTTLQKPVTLSHVKSGLDCIQYEEGMSWNQVFHVVGSPDIAPIPEPGTDLTKNARIYKDKTIIFYTEIREVKEDGRVRFQEVVTKIEFCKKK